MNTNSVSIQTTDGPTQIFDFGHLLRSILTKSWVIILCVVLALAAAIAYLVWAQKLYESRAVIEVEQETPKVNNVQDFNADTAQEIGSAQNAL